MLVFINVYIICKKISLSDAWFAWILKNKDQGTYTGKVSYRKTKYMIHYQVSWKFYVLTAKL